MNRAFLFWIEDVPSAENWESPTRGEWLDSLTRGGLAEWFDCAPDLFLLLLGPEPQVCPWPVYDHGNHPPALICAREAAGHRLNALMHLATHGTFDAAGKALAACLAPVSAALDAQSPGGYLVLDFSETLSEQHGDRYGCKGFKRAVEDLRLRATELAAELLESSHDSDDGYDPPAAPSLRLQNLTNHPVRATGYWGPGVGEGWWMDCSEEPEQLPTFLSEFDGDWYGHGSPAMDSAAHYDIKLGAYVVRRCAKGQPNLYGAVTPYGRWLVPIGSYHLEGNGDDDAARRGWIIARRETLVAPEEYSWSDYGLLDANGTEVVPMVHAFLCTVGDKLVYYQTQDAAVAGKRRFELMRIDSGEVLERNLSNSFCLAERSDGFIQAELFDANGRGDRCGLLNYDGHRCTSFDFGGISSFHKRHKLAIAWREGLCGLIDTTGRIVLPLAYSEISTKTDVPHFHQDCLLICTEQRDAEGAAAEGRPRVGIADKNGRVIVQPTMSSWDWHPTFDRDGRVLVYRGDEMYYLYADGSLSTPVGSVQASLGALRDHFDRMSRGQSLQDTPDLQSLAAEVDRASCNELIAILCRGHTATAAALQQTLAKWLAECAMGEEGTAALDRDHEGVGEDEDDGYDVHKDDDPATPFFRRLAYHFCNESLWMQLDWKAVDQISCASAHLPDLRVLESFAWDGMANGEGIEEGLAALSCFLMDHGFRALSFDNGGDEYVIGVVTRYDFDQCMALSTRLGLPLTPN